MGLSKKQLAARLLAIGASEIAAIAGFSRWKKAIDVFNDKMRPPEDSHAYPSLAAELGDLIEEPIAKLAASRMGLFFRPVDTLRRDDKEFALCTPDRAAFRTIEDRGPDGRKKIRTLAELEKAVGLVQVKHTTMRLRYEWGEPGTDEVPDYFYPQGIWECGTTRMQRNTFAVLFDKAEFGLYPVDYRADLYEGLYEIAARFMVDHVLKGKAPPPDASDAYADYLNAKFSQHNGKVETPSEEIERKILKWALLKATEKRAEVLAKAISNELRAELKEFYGFAKPTFGKVLCIRSKPSSITKWSECTSDLLALAEKLAAAEDPAVRAALIAEARGIVEKHTTATPGYAYLKLFPGKSDAAQLKSQPLKVELAALEENADQKAADEKEEAA